MNGIAFEAMWMGIWFALGLMVGGFGVWSVLSKRIDATARNLSMAAHEVAKINPRDEMSAEEFAEAAGRAGFHVIRPVSATPQGNLAE